MTRDKILGGFKIGLTAVAGLGITILCSAFAGSIAGQSNAGTIKKACMAIGGAVVGGILSNQAEKYINSEVDSAVQQYDELADAIKKARAGKAAEASE